MADSVVHVEMEDVLNSVRRLVSEGDEDSDGVSDRDEICFVLTPAHRVEDGTPRFQHKPVPTEASEPVQDQVEQPPELGQLLTDVSRQTDPAPEAAKKADEHPRTPSNFTAFEYQSMAEAWKKELAASTSGNGNGGSLDALETTVPATPDTADISLEDRIAELEEAVSLSREDWEPDGSEPNKKPELRGQIYEVVDNTHTLEDNWETPATTKDDPEPAILLSDKNDAPADADANTQAEIEDTAPMFSHRPRSREVPLVLVEQVEPDARATEAPANEAQNPGSPEGPNKMVDFPAAAADLVQDDDVFLDVEALRSMIGELVRDELRGKMGERITQNVRQMVRQEIERALLSSDLD